MSELRLDYEKLNLGMQRKEIFLSSYCSEWADCFHIESQILHKHVGVVLKSLYHIGSTSIPGMCARPIIDIMGICQNMELFKQYGLDSLKELGYKNAGLRENQNRCFLIKYNRDGTKSYINFQIYKEGDDKILDHLLFKEFLIRHQKVKEDYCALKTELRRKFRHDCLLYDEEKKQFIDSVVEQAKTDSILVSYCQESLPSRVVIENLNGPIDCSKC